MPQVLIYYEHKVREMQYCTALKYELNRRGYSAAICHFHNRHTWWHKIFSRPKVIVIGTMSMVHGISDLTFMEDRCDFIRGRAPFVVNLQIEQLFRDDGASYNIVSDADVQNRIYYVCWGQKRYAQLRNSGIPPEYIWTLGAMHLDFLRPEFAGYYKVKEELGPIYHLDCTKRWLLYISSFTYVNAPKEKLNAWFQHMKHVDPLITWSTIQARIDSSTDSQSITLDWLDRFLAETDAILIYRPHPGERITPELQCMLETYPSRFMWIKNESVQQWIFACEVVNNWISTSVVEAYVAKKSVNIVQPVFVPLDLQPVILDECQRIQDYALFAAAQDANKEFNAATFPMNQNLLYQYYKLDGDCTYLRVCDLIELVYAKPAPDVGCSKFTWLHVFQKYFLYRAYRSFYAITRLKLSKIFPIKRKGLKNREFEVDKGVVSEDIIFTSLDRQNFKKIKIFVDKIGKLTRTDGELKAGRDLF